MTRGFYERTTEYERTCEYCGDPFIAKINNAKYCTENCRQAVHRDRQREAIANRQDQDELVNVQGMYHVDTITTTD